MKDLIVEAWIEIEILPRGRFGHGPAEWRPIVRGRTERGIISTSRSGHVFATRDDAIAAARRVATQFGLHVRSADVIPFRREVAA